MSAGLRIFLNLARNPVPHRTERSAAETPLSQERCQRCSHSIHDGAERNRCTNLEASVDMGKEYPVRPSSSEIENADICRSSIPEHPKAAPVEMPIRINKLNMPTQGGNDGNWCAPDAEYSVDLDSDRISEAIMPSLRTLGFTDEVKISRFGGGGYNEIFLVKGGHSIHFPLLLRVAHKPCHWYGIESEVATMEFVRRHTSIPVPRVHAYDSSWDNPVGSSWMLVEFIEARSYADVENSLSRKQRRAIGSQIAEWTHELRSLSFDSIGSIYHDGEGFKLGPLMSQIVLMTWEDKMRTGNRGPFASTEQYYRSIWEHALYKSLSRGDSTQVTKDALEVLTALPQMLPQNDLAAHPACLHHVDITDWNVLVDEQGRAVALIDWEMAHTMPSHITHCQVPWIIEREATPSPIIHSAIQQGFYDRMEELKPGFRPSIMRDEAIKTRKLHRLLESINGPVDMEVMEKQAHVVFEAPFLPLRMRPKTYVGGEDACKSCQPHCVFVTRTDM